MSVGVWCVTDLRLGDEATVRKAIAGPEGRCRREACCTRASVHTVPSAHLVVPEREWWSRVPCPVHTTEEVVRAGRGGERGGLRALAKRRPRRAAHRVVDLSSSAPQYPTACACS